MPEFDDRERTLILTALWNYKLRAGQVNAPMGAAEEQRGASEQAPGGTIDQIHALVANWAGTPICPSSVSAARSPNSEAGTTHASRLGVRNASLVHDWIARYPDFPQPVARLKAAHVWAWPDVEACALRDRAGYRKDEVMNEDPGMPLNALDQLRLVFRGGRVSAALRATANQVIRLLCGGRGDPVGEPPSHSGGQDRHFFSDSAAGAVFLSGWWWLSWC